MKIFFHTDFLEEYTYDPAAESGRMEGILEEIKTFGEIISCNSAMEDDILAVHGHMHLEHIRRQGLYDISVLAAGGAIQAARTCLEEPSFALIRPPVTMPRPTAVGDSAFLTIWPSLCITCAAKVLWSGPSFSTLTSTTATVR